MKGLDLSFAQPTLAWWQARYAEGHRVAVQDAWTGVAVPGNPALSLSQARVAGFVTAAYVVVNLTNGATSVAKAKAACGAEWAHLNFVAIDVEVSGITWAQYKASILAAETAIKADGLRPVIYTARWFWVGHLGNPVDLKDRWLWNAFYDNDPDIDFPSNPYGGFTKVMGEQYQGTTQLAGYAVDLNTFDDTFIKEGDMGMTPEELARLDKVEKALQATVGLVRFNIDGGVKQYTAIGGFKVWIPDLNALKALGLGRTPLLQLTSADTLAKLPELSLTTGITLAQVRAEIEGVKLTPKVS